MVLFSIPGIYSRFSLNVNIKDLYRFCPEKFISGFRIGTVYGSFPNMVWNGDLNLIGTMTSRDVRDIVRAYNEMNIRIRTSCTNSLAQQLHKDRLCNIVMTELTSNKSNSAEVIPDSNLGMYISARYPDMYREVICRDVQRVSELLDKYYKITVSPALNQDISTYQHIDKNLRHRIEIQLNPYCTEDCECIEFCQSQIHSKQIRYMRNTDILCDRWSRSFNDLADNSPFFIDRKKMKDLANIGYTHFRICDNGNIGDLISAYCYYFAKNPSDGLALRQAFEGWCGLR